MADPPSDDVPELEMTTLNIALDDDVADRARMIKNELGLTWEEFIIRTTHVLEQED